MERLASQEWLLPRFTAQSGPVTKNNYPSIYHIPGPLLRILLLKGSVFKSTLKFKILNSKIYNL
jgi:hypothetical protein